MKEEREILFGGYNRKGRWVEGSACKDDDNVSWLILGPYMSEETDVHPVNYVYQYTGMKLNEKRLFEGCRIIGGYQWMEGDGTAMSREIDDTVTFFMGSWVLDGTGEDLYDLLNNNQLYWDAEVLMPEE